MPVASAAKEIQIVIPAIEKRHLRVQINGVTPLISHRFSEEKIEEIEKKQQGAAKLAKQPRQPDVEYRGSLYVIDEEAGRYGFPGGGIKKALVTAGGRFAGGTMTQLRGVITIPAELLEITGSEPKMRRDVVRLMNGSADIRYRAEFWPWSMMVPVIYNASIITLDQVVNLFHHAGFEIGIGDWRLESKNGMFGQFEVGEVSSL